MVKAPTVRFIFPPKQIGLLLPGTTTGKGLTRILDPVLIEELLSYDDGNFDRVLGFAHAVTYCKYLDKYYKVEEEEHIEINKTNKQHAGKSPFSFGGKNPYAIGGGAK